MKFLQRMVCLLGVSLLFSASVFAAQEIGSVSEVIGGVDILKGGKLPAEPAKVGEKAPRGILFGPNREVRFRLISRMIPS